MDLVEDIRVSQECFQAGLGAKIDLPAAIFDMRKIGGIGVAEFSTAEGNEARILLLLWRWFRHLNNQVFNAAGDGG